jgi:hypothetical protein
MSQEGCLGQTKKRRKSKFRIPSSQTQIEENAVKEKGMKQQKLVHASSWNAFAVANITKQVHIYLVK